MSKDVALPQPFPLWFKNQWKLLFRVPFTPAIAAAIISAALSVMTGVKTSIPYLTAYLYSAQLLAIIFLMVFVIYGYEPPKYRRGATYIIATEAVEQFLFFWKCLWCSWFLLYVALTAQAFGMDPEDKSGVGYYIRTMAQILNNLPAIFCFMLYQIISTRTVKTSKPKYWQDDLTASLAFWVTILVGAALAESLLMLGSNSEHWHDVFKEFGNFYYAFSALATMLLATSIGSVTIDVPRWSFYMLAAYGAIQPLFGFLQHIPGSHDQTTVMAICQAIAVTYALIAKALLFIVIYWLADTGRLHYYMAENRSLLDNAPLRIGKWLQKAKAAQ